MLNGRLEEEKTNDELDVKKKSELPGAGCVGGKARS